MSVAKSGRKKERSGATQSRASALTPPDAGAPGDKTAVARAKTAARGRAPEVKGFDGVPPELERLLPARALRRAAQKPPAQILRSDKGGEASGDPKPAARAAGRTARPRWRRRADARPDEILDAALEVFSREGFEAARVEDVAKVAGLSKGAVYLYFPSKEDLLRALIAREVAPFAKGLGVLADAGKSDPKAALKTVVGALGAMIADPKRFQTPKVVLAVAARFPEIGRYYREAVVEIAAGAVAALIAEGARRGEFRKVDPKAAARFVLGPILLEGLWRHILQGPADERPDAARAAAHFDLLMHGLGAGEAA